MNNLWTKSNYLNKGIKYLSNVKIYEYDMKSGGYSILKEKGFFTDIEIKYLERVDKLTRNVYIGKKLMRNVAWNKELIEGFKEAIKQFFERNNIPEEVVLSIKKDALFIIDVNLGNKVIIDHITFELKNTYTSYYNLNGIEFYYNKTQIDVKGISDEIVEEHLDYFLGDLVEIFEVVETNNQRLIIDRLKEYRRDYISKSLPIEHYKEFNRRNAYAMVDYGINIFYIPYAEDSSINTINTNFNYNAYIKPLISYLI